MKRRSRTKKTRRQYALFARVVGLRKGHNDSTSNQHLFAANKQFKIILDLASFSSVQAFMEEDQQDSGGEYDLQEGFDRLMIFCGENQTESLEFCKLHCEFTGWFSNVFPPVFSTNMKNQLQ